MFTIIRPGRLSGLYRWSCFHDFNHFSFRQLAIEFFKARWIENFRRHIAHLSVRKLAMAFWSSEWATIRIFFVVIIKNSLYVFFTSLSLALCPFSVVSIIIVSSIVVSVVATWVPGLICFLKIFVIYTKFSISATIILFLEVFLVIRILVSISVLTSWSTTTF